MLMFISDEIKSADAAAAYHAALTLRSAASSDRSQTQHLETRRVLFGLDYLSGFRTKKKDFFVKNDTR